MSGVLAAIDFSAVSDAVVDLAARLAGGFGGGVRLLHVAAPDPDFAGYEAGPDTVRQQRARTLRSEHRDLQERAEVLRGRGLEATARLIDGPAAETILDEAREHDVGLIVLGSHGRTGLRRLLVGSVSETVLRHAPCPVVVVPAAKD